MKYGGDHKSLRKWYGMYILKEIKINLFSFCFFNNFHNKWKDF